MIQTKTLDFTGKISGSTVANKNIGYMNGVEFTQSQYDLIFGTELRVSSTDELTFEFPIPDDVKIGLQEVQIYYKSKMDSGENELRSSDKAIYNEDKTMYKQKFLQMFIGDDISEPLKFKIKSTGDYGVYEVKVVVTYDDAGLNSYSGNYTYIPSGGTETTKTIDREKLEDIIVILETLPSNTLSYVTFSQVPSHDIV